MSKKNDMLGAIVRAMVGVPLQFLGVMLDLCNKLAGKDGELWYEKMRLALRENVTQVGAQTLVVLGATTLAARITAGRYNWVHFLIDKKNFPHDPASVGEWEWKLVKFASGTSSKLLGQQSLLTVGRSVSSSTCLPSGRNTLMFSVISRWWRWVARGSLLANGA